jgi:multidrug resistance efflux pump
MELSPGLATVTGMPTSFRTVSPETPVSWIPVSSASDTAVALEAELGPDRPWVGRLLLFLTAVALTAGFWVEVDVTARAPGLVRARTETADVRSPATGAIETVWVRPGDWVIAGQPLLQVGDPAWESRRAALRQRGGELEVATAEWELLLQSVPADEAGADAGAASPLFRTAWAARLWAEFLAQDAADQLVEARARREADRLEQLGERGLVSERDLDDARFEAAARESARRTARQRQLAVWQERHRDAESQRLLVAAEATGLDHQREALVLRAPLSGELLELASLEKGSVVMAGQALGRLSPEASLQIEVFVPSRTAALLRTGQRGRASFSALPATEWGLLPLQVESIASDARWERGEAVFRVIARPESTELRTRDGRVQTLRKGFVADVRFQLGRTTLALYLRTKASDWIEGAPPAGPTL